MKTFSNNFKYISALWVILILTLIFTMFHHGHLLIDCGREVYYPTQILEGKILYKDLFNIYGPFSYMLNAFLFKIFGIHLNVFYAAGILSSFSIVTLIYFIAKRFLPKFLSFTIGAFTITLGVVNVHVFNLVFPYSFAILYGLVAFLFSLLLLLKYVEKPEKNLFLYLSAFFAGVCISSKYEFLPYALVILYAMIKVKPLRFLNWYYSLLALLFMPIFCFGVLFMQGLGINDLISTVLILKKMAGTETLKYFYNTQGVYFTKYTLFLIFGSFFAAGASLWGLLKSFEIKNRITAVALFLISVFILLKFKIILLLSFLPWFVVVFAIINREKLKANLSLQILVLASTLVSLKMFSGLILANYGVYFASILLTAALALILKKYKEINIKVLSSFILLIALILSSYNIKKINAKTELIKTFRGKIYSTKLIATSTQKLIDYIEKNTQKNDTIVIFPEGQFINFLTDRKTDNYYNSLIPLYWEIFSDELLIEHFKKTKPEYIIFNNMDNSNYYFKYICQDYAVNFCNFVATNYTLKTEIEGDLRYLVYKRK